MSPVKRHLQTPPCTFEKPRQNHLVPLIAYGDFVECSWRSHVAASSSLRTYCVWQFTRPRAARLRNIAELVKRERANRSASASLSVASSGQSFCCASDLCQPMQGTPYRAESSNVASGSPP